MKIIHTILTIITVLYFIHSTVHLINTFEHLNERNIVVYPLGYVGLFIGSYAMTGILLLIRHFVGKKIKRNV